MSRYFMNQSDDCYSCYRSVVILETILTYLVVVNHCKVEAVIVKK